MAGCYGDSTEDRYFEGKLNEYLKSQEKPETETMYECPYCGDLSYKNTMCCEEMHREEKEIEIEVDEEDFNIPDEHTKEDW